MVGFDIQHGTTSGKRFAKYQRVRPGSGDFSL